MKEWNRSVTLSKNKNKWKVKRCFTYSFKVKRVQVVQSLRFWCTSKYKKSFIIIKSCHMIGSWRWSCSSACTIRKNKKSLLLLNQNMVTRKGNRILHDKGDKNCTWAWVENSFNKILGSTLKPLTCNEEGAMSKTSDQTYEDHLVSSF